MLYSKPLLVIYFIYSSVYISIPISQFIPSPLPPGSHKFVFYICDSISVFLKNKFIYLFIYLFIYGCVGSLLLCAGFSLVAAIGGYSLLRCVGFSLQWLLLLRSMGSRHVGSVVVACGLSSCGSRALERRLSSCGSQAQLLRGMWDLPGPGLEPVSPALAGRFSTKAAQFLKTGPRREEESDSGSKRRATPEAIPEQLILDQGCKQKDMLRKDCVCAGLKQEQKQKQKAHLRL